MFGNRVDLGKVGEKLALAFLVKRGYEIIERNFWCPFGEVDIIAKDGQTVSFIEVKTRKSTLFGMPFESIVKKKQGHLVRASNFYLNRKGILDADCRFDVISVLFEKDCKAATVKLLKDAFGE